RTDQFAFCVTAWQAIFGQPPFAGRTLAELTTSVLGGKLEPPAAAATAPRWLRRICARGLSRDPGERFESLDVLVSQLERGQVRHRRKRGAMALAGAAAVGAAALGVATLEERKRVDACRHAGQQLSDALDSDRRAGIRGVLLASNLGYAETLADKTIPLLNAYAREWGSNRETSCLRGTVHDTMDAPRYARAQWCLDTKKLGFEALLVQLQTVDPATASRAIELASGLPPPSVCLDPTYLSNAPDPPEATPDVAEIRAELAALRVLFATGDYAEGLPRARAAVERARATASPSTLVAALLVVADIAGAAGEHEASERAGLEAYELAARARGWGGAADAALGLGFLLGSKLDRPVEARIWARHAGIAASLGGDPLGLLRAEAARVRGIIESKAGNFEEAAEEIRVAVDLYERALHADHPKVAGTLNSLANVQDEVGDLPAAVTLFERVLRSAEASLGPDHPQVGKTLNNLGAAKARLGDLEAARPLHERALEIAEAALGPDHPGVAGVVVNLAALHFDLGEYDESITLGRRALRIDEASYGKEHPNVAMDLGNLSASYFEMGRYAEAVTHARRAVQIIEAALGPDHPRLIKPLNSIAISLMKLDRLEEAQALLERGLVIAEAKLGDNPKTADLLNSLGSVLVLRGEAHRALPLQLRALKMHEEALGLAHPAVAFAVLLVGETEVALGRPDRALPYFERAVAIFDRDNAVSASEPDARFALGKLLAASPETALRGPRRDGAATGDRNRDRCGAGGNDRCVACNRSRDCGRLKSRTRMDGGLRSPKCSGNLRECAPTDRANATPDTTFVVVPRRPWICVWCR
ncbi:MAG: protein kinase family protein, partial [Myxococcota bacterium]